MKSTWYPLFDVYRILFALWVVAIHVSEFAHLDLHLPAFHPVAAFVCLSGFLIPRALRRSPSYGRFAWKRACRVLPAFIASLLLVALLPGWGLKAVAASLLTYMTMALVYPSFAPANGPLWSLALEEILYAFHAFLHRVTWLPWVMLLLCLSWALTHPWSQLTNIFFVASCFFLGNLLERVEWKLPAWLWVIAIVGVVKFQGRLGEWGEGLIGVIQPGLGGQFAWLVSTVLICVCLIGLGVSWRPKIRIPDLSYGVYIYHFPIALWGLGQAGWGVWQVVLATLVLAVVSWSLLEAPALGFKDWNWPGSRREVGLGERDRDGPAL